MHLDGDLHPLVGFPERSRVLDIGEDESNHSGGRGDLSIQSSERSISDVVLSSSTLSLLVVGIELRGVLDGDLTSPRSSRDEEISHSDDHDHDTSVGSVSESEVSELLSCHHRVVLLGSSDVDGGLVGHEVPKSLVGEDDELVRLRELPLSNVWSSIDGGKEMVESESSRHVEILVEESFGRDPSFRLTNPGCLGSIERFVLVREEFGRSLLGNDGESESSVGDVEGLVDDVGDNSRGSRPEDRCCLSWDASELSSAERGVPRARLRSFPSSRFRNGEVLVAGLVEEEESSSERVLDSFSLSKLSELLRERWSEPFGDVGLDASDEGGSGSVGSTEDSEERLVLLPSELRDDHVGEEHVFVLSERVRDSVGHVVDFGKGGSNSTVVAFVGERDSEGDVHETEDSKVGERVEVGDVWRRRVVVLVSLVRLDLESLVPREVEVSEFDVLRPEERRTGEEGQQEEGSEARTRRKEERKKNEPVPVEPPIVDVVLENVASDVEDLEVDDGRELCWQRLKLVPVEMKDPQLLRVVRQVLRRNARQLVPREVERDEMGVLPKGSFRDLRDLVEAEVEGGEFRKEGDGIEDVVGKSVVGEVELSKAEPEGRREFPCRSLGP